MPSYLIRRATVSDASAIVRHRVGMFRDMGELTADEALVVQSATLGRLVAQLESGEYLGWLTEIAGATEAGQADGGTVDLDTAATTDRRVVAGAGVVLHQYYPSRANPRGRPTAYILNVYTEPEHRRRGLAHDLISEVLVWCRAHDIPRASLHASRFGRSVYNRLGFEETNEMRLDT